MTRAMGSTWERGPLILGKGNAGPAVWRAQRALPEVSDQFRARNPDPGHGTSRGEVMSRKWHDSSAVLEVSMDRRAFAVTLLGAVAVALVLGLAVAWLQLRNEEPTMGRSDGRACQLVEKAVMVYGPADRARLLRSAERSAVPGGEVHHAVSDAIATDEAGGWYAPDAQKLLQACDARGDQG